MPMRLMYARITTDPSIHRAKHAASVLCRRRVHGDMMATSASQSDTGSFFAPLRGEGPFRIACITTGRGTCTGAALWKDVNTGARRFFFVRFGGLNRESPRVQHWRWHSAASRRLHSPSKRPVARDSARRLVRLDGQRVNGRRNVNSRSAGRQHLRANRAVTDGSRHS